MSCFACSDVMSNNELFKQHFNQKHKSTTKFYCHNCDEIRSFTSKYSFFKHMDLHFKKTNEEPMNQQLILNEEDVHHIYEEPPMVDMEHELSDQENNDEHLYQPEINYEELTGNLDIDSYKIFLYDKSLRFVSDLYDDVGLCRSTIQTCIKKTTSFMESGPVSLIKRFVVKRLKLLNEDQTKIDELEKLFDMLETPFKKFETDYLRTKAFEERNVYIKPVKHAVGDRLDPSCVDNQIILIPKIIHSQHIPLRLTLQNFLQTKNTFQTIIHFKNSLDTDTEISNFMQSSLWKKKIEHFDSESIVLPILLYFDDFETNNPLGSRSGIQKVGGVYAVCPFIPPEFSSKLENIFLVSLFNSQDRVAYGNNMIFEPIIRELKFLEENGIEIEIENQIYRIYFMLGLIIGDNLGLNSMLGYVESFSAIFCCRLCYCPKHLLHKQCKEDVSLMRTKDSYSNDIIVNNVSLTGRKEECVWHSIESFHVCENISVDIMHDIFEGIAGTEVTLMLNNLIYVKKLLTLETLNFRISNFNHGPFDNFNLPQTMTKHNIVKNNLRYSTSEIKVFIKFLPLMIGDLVVDEDDKNWNFFLLLRNIIEIVLANSLSSGDIDLLESLIREHHETYQLLYNKTLIPKHHHMIHYPNIIRAVGPIRHLWSMRGESKHKILKRVASSTTSRVNICSTMAIRHQLSFSNMLLKNIGLETTIERGKIVSMNIQTLSYHDMIVAKFPNLISLDSLSWVKLKNIAYKRKMLVILSINEDENYPNFGEIKDIFYEPTTNKYFFVCKELKTLYVDYHLSAYVVQEQITFAIKTHEYYLKTHLLIKKTDLYVPF